MYYFFSFLILVSLGFLIGGICVVIFARSIEKQIFENIMWPYYKKLSKFWRMNDEDMAVMVNSCQPSRFRLWVTRLWGASLAIIAAVGLFAVIFTWVRV